MRKTRFLFLLAFAAFASNDTTYIRTFDDLQSIGANLSGGGIYALANEIDASPSRGRSFRPIGSYGRPFTGVFDGRGFAVRGLYVNRPGESHVGLFGFIGAGAEVFNLGVAADSVAGDFYVGALAGFSNGVIRGCWSSGVVMSGHWQGNAGGLAGGSGGTIIVSYSTAAVSGKGNAGGLVGLLTSNAAGLVSGSYAAGSASGGSNAGGLVGYAMGGAIENSFSSAGVKGGAGVGGLVGYDYVRSNADWTSVGRTGSGALAKSVDVSGDCFYDRLLSGLADGGGTPIGRSLQTEQINNLDYGDNWIKLDGYPRLKDVPLYTVSYGVRGNGKLSVAVNGSAAEPADFFVRTVRPFDTVTVAAAPAPGSSFTEWSDGVKSVSREYTVMRGSAPDSVSAIFAVDSYTVKYYVKSGSGVLTVNIGDGEDVEVIEDTIVIKGVTYGTALKSEIRAVPGVRYGGVWLDGYGSNVRSGDMITGDTSFCVEFVRIYTLTYLADGEGKVAIEGEAGDESRRAASLSILAEAGSAHRVKAIPNDTALYGFLRWSDGAAGAVREDIAGGDMTVTAVFVRKGAIPIYTLGELGSIGRASDYPLSGYYVLRNDIDINADSLKRAGGFIPISSNSRNPFTGTFDGQGYAIRGLCINQAERNRVGLFESLGGNGTIRDLRVVADSVTGKDTVGGLVGFNAGGKIIECFFAGTVKAAGGTAGGLVGYNSGGSAERCYSAGAVSASTAGGLAGVNGVGAVVRDCYSLSEVSGLAAAGGIAGRNAGTVENCYFAGSAGGTGSVGGVTGVAVGSGAVVNSYWDEEASGQSASAGGKGKTTEEMGEQGAYEGWDFGGGGVWRMGEIGGYPRLRKFAVITVSSYGDLRKIGMSADWPLDWEYRLVCDIDARKSGEPGSAFRPIGAFDPNAPERVFSGIFDGGDYTVRNLTVRGGDRQYQGLFGRVSGKILRLHVSDCDISGSGYVGGLAGSLHGGGEIMWCGVTGKVTGSAHYVGGLAGESDSAVIAYCYYEGSVNGSQRVGGLAGGARKSGISRSYSMISESVAGGTGDVGGLIGSARDCDIVNCFSAGGGKVAAATGSAGGLVGSRAGGTVENCYAAIRVEGAGAGIGGLTGVKEEADPGAAVVSSYWDRDVSGCAASAGGEGKSSAEMKTESIYKGWDFDSDWVTGGQNGGYPCLRWNVDFMDEDEPGRPAAASPGLNVSDIAIIPPPEQSAKTSVVAVPGAEVTPSAGLTAGPNPVNLRRDGKVKFYRTGRELARGFLAVYDATGGLVRRIPVTERFGSTGKREVAVWDLTDKKGRRVSGGTYLVRGVLTAVNGEREKVSLILGVR